VWLRTEQGGQAQRVTLAICLALQPAFLLLDEPTSALDHDSALAVERVLQSCGAGLVWVTHEDAQTARVGGRVLQLPLGTEVLFLFPHDFLAASP
jgi:ABC-type phosphate transport system ATPase subunit